MLSPDHSPDPRRPSLFNVPNTLTFIRILAIPGVVYLMYGENNAWSDFWAAALFGLAFWTDYFDGLIARRTQTVTRLGKIMDPIADKLIVLASMLMLVYLNRIDVVVAILLLGREIAVSGLRSLAGSEGILIPSRFSGKAKTFVEGFAIGFLCLGPENLWLNVEWMELGRVLLYIALGLALWSAVMYFRDYYGGSVAPSA